jgi:hypothetical protein
MCLFLLSTFIVALQFNMLTQIILKYLMIIHSSFVIFRRQSSHIDNCTSLRLISSNLINTLYLTEHKAPFGKSSINIFR